MTLGASRSEIEEFWDEQGLASGEFMQLLDWADLEAPKLCEELNRISMPAFVDDSETTCLAINDALRETFGVDEEDFRDLERLRAVSAERQRELDSLVHRLWSEGKSFSATVELERRSSNGRWFWMRSIPIVDSEGRVVRAVGLVIDIHERVIAQIELERSEQQLRKLLDNLGDGVIGVDCEHIIRIWNKEAETIFGYLAEEVIGQEISALHFAGEDGAGSPRVLKPGEAVLRRRKDGSEVLVELNPTEMLLQGRTFTVTTVRDVSAREALLAERQKNEQQIRMLLDNLADPVVALDASQRIRIWNQPAGAMFGYSEDEVLGKSVSMLLPPEAADGHKDLVIGYFESDDAARLMHNSAISLQHRDGSPIRVEINLSKMELQDGALAVATIRDVAEREAFLEGQHKADEKFSALIDRSSDAILILSAGEVITYASPAIERLSGYRPDQTVGFDLEVVLSNVHPDDRAWIESGIRGIQLEHAARGDFDYRQIHRDGNIKYISASVTNYLNVEGIAGLVFNMRDVSEAKLLKIRVELQNEELKAVLAAFPDLLHQITSEGVVAKCLTPAASEFLETTQVVGESLRATMGERSGSDFEKVVSRVSRLKRPETIEFAVFSSVHSTERCIEARVSPLPNGDVLASFRDVSAERELQLQLLHQALHDELTGLPNRALLTSELSSAIDQAGESRLGVGVLFLDLDGFKEVNDRFGHQSGDGLLVEVALRLRAVVRPQDTVARIGGDEFVIVCASLRHHHEAEVLADRICVSMGLPFQVEGQEVVISTSIGIAFADDSLTGVEALIARADAAMYSAKELGKGRAEVFNTSML